MKLTDIRLHNNMVLIRSFGPNDTVRLKSGLELMLGYSSVDAGKHASIMGEVILLPRCLVYSKALYSSPHLSKDERVSLVGSSMSFLTDMVLEVGDIVLYDYLQNKASLQEKRVLDIDGIGECLLINYEMIFGYRDRDISRGVDIEDNYVPINGNIFFRRRVPREREVRGSGIELVLKRGIYDEDFGVVVSCSPYLSDYLRSGDSDFGYSLESGDEIFIRRGHGFRIAYDIHAPDCLKGIEVIRRPMILAVS